MNKAENTEFLNFLEDTFSGKADPAYESCL